RLLHDAPHEPTLPCADRRWRHDASRAPGGHAFRAHSDDRKSPRERHDAGASRLHGESLQAAARERAEQRRLVPGSGHPVAVVRRLRASSQRASARCFSTFAVNCPWPRRRGSSFRQGGELVDARRRGVRQVVEALADHPPSAELVLFVDQLEELFTLTAERYRKPFVDLIATAADTARLRTGVTLRA